MYTNVQNPIIEIGSTLKSAIYVMIKIRLGAVSVIDNEGTLCGLITAGDLKQYMVEIMTLFSWGFLDNV